MLDAGLRVARADLDRAELRVRADVVPEVRVVLHDARLDHEADALLVVLPVLVRRRDADARERAEDRHPRRHQPGAVGAPERRVRRQRQQHGHVDAHPVGDVDRLLGVVDADVDVHAEDELLARDEPQRLDEVAVARPARRCAGPPTSRTDACPAEPIASPLRLRRGADPPPQRAQLVAGLARVGARVRGDLEHRLHELGLDRRRRRCPRAAARSRWTSSSVSPSTIISSSSMPSV